MARLEIESRHSDYGEDAGGYRVLRFDGEWVGRVTDYEAGEKLVKFVERLVLGESAAVEKEIRDGNEILSLTAERDALKAEVESLKKQLDAANLGWA